MAAQLPERGQTSAQVLIQGDQSILTFGAVQSMVIGILDSYLEGVESNTVGEIMAQIPGVPVESGDTDFVKIETENIAGTEESSIFDYFAPGIIVFGLLLGVIAVAESMAKMVEDHTLSRLKISMMSSFDLLFGSLISWTLFAGLQVLILFAVALALGFNWVGGSTSLALALLVGCIVGIACISLGMLIAAFARDTEHASSLGTLVSIPMSFVIGVFFQFPPGLFTKVVGVLPWRQGLLSLHELLTYGSTLEEVAPNITALVIETAVLFVVGVIAFSKFRLKAE
jgi:ABC-2 type transport system permease protein